MGDITAMTDSATTLDAPSHDEHFTPWEIQGIMIMTADQERLRQIGEHLLTDELEYATAILMLIRLKRHSAFAHHVRQRYTIAVNRLTTDSRRKVIKLIRGHFPYRLYIKRKLKTPAP